MPAHPVSGSGQGFHLAEKLFDAVTNCLLQNTCGIFTRVLCSHIFIIHSFILTQCIGSGPVDFLSWRPWRGFIMILLENNNCQRYVHLNMMERIPTETHLLVKGWNSFCEVQILLKEKMCLKRGELLQENTHGNDEELVARMNFSKSWLDICLISTI